MSESLKTDSELLRKARLFAQNWHWKLSPGLGFSRLVIKSLPYGLSFGGAMYLDKPHGWGLIGLAFGIIIADGFADHCFEKYLTDRNLEELQQKSKR